jgi:catechol 2,3-dioxygenase-like lactoylglutathione lyase family enzyme
VSQPPEITFLSLFVPDLKEAARCYQEVLGLEPVPNQGQAPDPHPFAGSAPVLFELGQVRIALYEANPNRGTHAGDVGIGVRFHQGLAAVAERAKHNRATTLYGPKRLPGDGREIAVFALPDRHFLEVVDR